MNNSVIEIAKPKIHIDAKIMAELKTQTDELGQVILHFIYFAHPLSEGNKIRIWPTSFLYDLNSSHESSLVYAENISLYPTWMDVEPGGQRYFTLIFSGLPKSCTMFDFVEQCSSQYGAFEVRNIKRNNTDVYFFAMS